RALVTGLMVTIVLPYPTLFRSTSTRCLACRTFPVWRRRGHGAYRHEIRRHVGCRRRQDPQCRAAREARGNGRPPSGGGGLGDGRSEEHTSELQSREKLVCRLLL